MAESREVITKRVNGMLLKDLRVELRARGLNPAGGMDALRERLTDSLMNPTAAAPAPASEVHAATDLEEHHPADNNYARPGGQNTGNFITDRPSSRVLQQPGGASQISFNWAENEAPAAPAQVAPEPVVAAPEPAVEGVVAPKEAASASPGNNYARPGGQNTGNFITDRPSSKVLAPPGGGSSISFDQIGAETANRNNYARPGGQNTGNFITDRPSSKVLQTPGGASQIMFG